MRILLEAQEKLDFFDRLYNIHLAEVQLSSLIQILKLFYGEKNNNILHVISNYLCTLIFLYFPGFLIG